MRLIRSKGGAFWEAYEDGVDAAKDLSLNDLGYDCVWSGVCWSVVVNLNQIEPCNVSSPPGWIFCSFHETSFPLCIFMCTVQHTKTSESKVQPICRKAQLQINARNRNSFAERKCHSFVHKDFQYIFSDCFTNLGVVALPRRELPVTWSVTDPKQLKSCRI